MTEQTTAPNISLTDFVIVVNIIDACSQRGSFKGDELTAVGQLRDKFATFIKANTPEEPSEDTTVDETTAETSE
jgi:hypothetical protein